jgi:hypothetical protein
VLVEGRWSTGRACRRSVATSVTGDGASTGYSGCDRWACSAWAVVRADLPLEHVFVSDRWGPMQLRWAYFHLTSEYDRHNGHADLLRERIDGSTGT